MTTEILPRAWHVRASLAVASSAARRRAASGERRRMTATWSALDLSARWYVATVTIVGGIALAVSIAYVPQYDWRIFAVLTALSLISSMMKVSLPVARSGSTLTVCYVIDFTSLLVLGAPAATLTAAIGGWSQCALRRREPAPVFQTWFSMGALALTAQASGLVYFLFGGQPGISLAPFPVEALIAAGTTFFIVNSVLVAMAIALTTNQSVTRVWTATYLWSWPGHLVGFAIAVGAAYGIGRSGLWLVPLALASLALTYENFNAYVTRFTDSVTDPLTGLPNVRHLLSHCAQELERSNHDSMPMAVILVDLDGFKSINDTFGHRAGDAALREVGRCIQQSIRSYDTCARYGGDEFVAVLSRCDADDAQRKAMALQAAVAALTFAPKSTVVPLRISVGVATFPNDGETFEELLTAADARMFADKEGHSPRRRREPDPDGTAASVDDELRRMLLEGQRMEAVGQLAGGVAHDFNNALTAILGYSDLLSEQIGPDKAIGRDLKEIAGAARHAASLTQHLLAFSRRQTLSTREVDVNEVVSRADSMLRRLIGERIAVATNLAVDLHSVIANATQLEQIVINLSLNARDAMPAGGTLTIGTRNVDVRAGGATHPHARPGPYVEMWVADCGVGMTPEIKARIFETFFTTKEPGKGTGLGLAAVHNIIRQLGGFIEVESEPGMGSTFHVHVPSTDHSAHTTPAAIPAALRPTPVGAETILLVEDEASVRQFATIALERHGYRVLEAHSAEAALTLLERISAPIDLLLTDVVLPGMDGCDLAARVEQLRPEIQVLFTSGYSDALRKKASAGDRPIDLIEKPFTARALLEKTRELLDRRAA